MPARRGLSDALVAVRSAEVRRSVSEIEEDVQLAQREVSTREGELQVITGQIKSLEKKAAAIRQKIEEAREDYNRYAEELVATQLVVAEDRGYAEQCTTRYSLVNYRESTGGASNCGGAGSTKKRKGGGGSKGGGSKKKASRSNNQQVGLLPRHCHAWPGIVKELQNAVPYFLFRDLSEDARKARKAYNNLVPTAEQISVAGPDPEKFVGLLLARGLNAELSELAKSFSRLLITANVLHLATGGHVADVVIFKNNAGSTAAWVTTDGLNAVRKTAQELSEDALKQSFMRAAPVQPEWEKMSAMAELGTKATCEGLPIFDTRAIFDHSRWGKNLPASEKSRFLETLAELLQTLSECLAYKSTIDPAPCIRRFMELLNQYRSGAALQ